MTRFFARFRAVYYLFSLSLLLLGYGCQDSSNPGKEGDMQFRVNEELLSDSLHFPLAGTSFSPPRNFHKMSSLTQEVSQSRLSIDSILVYEVFEDTLQKKEDLLSYMAFMHPQRGEEEKFLAYLETLTDSVFSVDIPMGEVRKDTFLYKGFIVEQSMRQAEDYISFFLSFKHAQAAKGVPFACSYFIPREAYTLPMIESIESSIGSFSPI